MNQLTNKEILLLEDSLKQARIMSKFAQSCSQQITDPQLKSLCQQIASDHNNDMQMLSRYLGSRTF